jgi:hypothetical protein
MTAPALPAVTLSLAQDALGVFFADVVAEFAAQGQQIPMADIPGLVSGGDYGDDGYHLQTVNVSGGSMTSPSFTVSAIAPATAGGTDGTFTVTANLTGHVTYAMWEESGEFSPPPSGGGGSVPHSDPFDDTYSGFSFDVSALPMTLTVAFTMSTDGSDPFDTSNALVVTVTGASAGAPQIANLNIPDGSVMDVGSLFGLISSDGAAQVASALGSSTNLVAAFIAGMNSMFAMIPDSGRITSGLAFLFPPTQLAFPAAGGFQMGVSGRLQTLTGARYPAPQTSVLPLPPVPASGMTILADEYLLNEATWSAAQAGQLNLTLPPAPASEWNTDALHSQLPALWNFAPSAPLSLMVTCDPANPPVAAFVPAWQASELVLGQVGAPVSVMAALAPYGNELFPSAAALTALLAAELQPLDNAQWATTIVNAAQTTGVTLAAEYSASLFAPKQPPSGGPLVPTDLVSFGLSLPLWVSSFAFTANATAGLQTLTFVAQCQGGSMSAVSPAPGLTFSEQDGQTLYTALLQPVLDQITAAIQAVGAGGLALPALPGFVLSSPQISIGTGQIAVCGMPVTS